jgi:hypothetical protein
MLYQGRSYPPGASDHSDKLQIDHLRFPSLDSLLRHQFWLYSVPVPALLEHHRYHCGSDPVFTDPFALLSVGKFNRTLYDLRMSHSPSRSSGSSVRCCSTAKPGDPDDCSSDHDLDRAMALGRCEPTFLGISIELRNTIYKHCAENIEFHLLRYEPWALLFSKTRHCLQDVSKQLAQEFVQYLVTEKPLQVSLNNPGPLLRPFTVPSPHAALMAQVKHLEVVWVYSYTTPLIKCLIGNTLSNHKLLQERFPKLRCVTFLPRFQKSQVLQSDFDTSALETALGVKCDRTCHQIDKMVLALWMVLERPHDRSFEISFKWKHVVMVFVATRSLLLAFQIEFVSPSTSNDCIMIGG